MTPSPPEARHPATAEAWEWLEHGDGQSRSEFAKDGIARQLRDLDRLLLYWDAGVRDKEGS